MADDVKIGGFVGAPNIANQDQFVSFFAYINDLAVQCLNAMS